MKWNKEIQEYFKSLNVEITLYPSGTIKKFTTIERFYAYYTAELEFWEKQNNQFYEIKTFYQNLYDNLVELNNYKDLEDIKNHVDITVGIAQENAFPNIPSTSSLAAFFIEVVEVNVRDLFSYLSSYLKNPTKHNMSFFNGSTERFNFLMKMLFIIEDNSKSNSKINSIVKHHENFLTDAEIEYQETKNTFKDDIKKLKEENKQLKSELQSWKENTQQNTESFLNNMKTKLEDLEALYTEKLKLSKPAEYWKNYAGIKRKSGRVWFALSVVLGAIIIGFSTFLLINLPGLFREENVLQWENVIRWSVLLALIYSSFFYILKLLVKMTLSAYHLANDAQERHQLTFQYLSLLQANAIEEKDKEIILQSLFSRADTGLLKGDSSPTMPDGLLSQVLRNLGG